MITGSYSGFELTSEYRRFHELYELVDFDEEFRRDFDFGESLE